MHFDYGVFASYKRYGELTNWVRERFVPSWLQRSPAFLMDCRRETAEMLAETRRATGAAAGVLDSTSRRPTERNAVSASISAVAAGNP